MKDGADYEMVDGQGYARLIRMEDQKHPYRVVKESLIFKKPDQYKIFLILNLSFLDRINSYERFCI